MHPASMVTPILAGLTLSSIAFITVRQEIQALDSLADAERAFAARCGKVGLRQSFIENFADNGVHFNPAPGYAVLDLKKRPEELQPPKSILFWAPETGDVSAAGDLGYTTGPFKFTPEDASKPPGYGQYFSVWHRENASSPWKVALDFGTRSTTPYAEPDKVLFKPAKDFKKTTARPGTGQDSLISEERSFRERARLVSFFEALKAMGTPNTRVHRDGALPSLPLNKAKDVLAGFEKTLEWTVMGSGIAQSGDLGYTYGRYTIESKGAPIKGYFARVWKRDEKGDWKIVDDIANRVSDPK